MLSAKLSFTSAKNPVSFKRAIVNYDNTASLINAAPVIISLYIILLSQWEPREPSPPSFSIYMPSADEQL